MRTIGGQSYFDGDTVDSQWTVQIHKLTDNDGRKFLLFETRSNDSTDGLEELFVQFAKVRHYHLSPLIAWQKVPNGYEWLFRSLLARIWKTCWLTAHFRLIWLRALSIRH